MKNIFIYIIFLNLFSFKLFASEPLLISEKSTHFDISNNIEKYKDIDQIISLEKILIDSTQFFAYNEDENPLNFHKKKNVFWIRFALKNGFVQDKELLLFFNSRWEKIDFYEVSTKKVFHKQTGSLIPVSQKDFQSPYSAVNILLKEGTEQIFYVRFEYTGSWAKPKYFTQDIIFKSEYLVDLAEIKIVQGMFFGIVLVMALYNLFLFFSLRDKSYFYYVMLLISMGLIFMANYRFDFEYLWPEHPKLQILFSKIPFNDVFCGFWILVFTQSFLNTRINFPKLHLFINVLNLISILVLLSTLLHIIESNTGWFLTSILGIIFLSTALFSGLIAFMKGFKTAKYFLTGIIFSSIGTIIFLIQDKFNVFPFDFKTYPMELGNTIDMIFFSLALANKINLLKEENNKQKELLISERLLQEQMRIVEKLEAQQYERLRIARDIHDDFGSGLSKINFLSEKIANDNVLESTMSGNTKAISETAKKLLENMRDLIWVLDPENTTLENLIARVREYSSDYLDDLSIELKSSYPDEVSPVIIEKESYREIFMAVKESLNNIAKHSKALNVTMQVSIGNNDLIISIQDNGKGFAISNYKEGNGLKNIRHRMVKIGGQFTIKSEQNRGTKICILIPLSKIIKL